jgi:hypothetical protein
MPTAMRWTRMKWRSPLVKMNNIIFVQTRIGEPDVIK